MPRCDNCKHFEPEVFVGTSATGYGVWSGYCAAGVDRGRNHHNLYIACEQFERGPNGFERPPPADHRPYQFALMAFENEGGAVVADWQDRPETRRDPVEARS